jgi:hypothetical protein
VGESEQACLARAEYHWEICGSNPFHQVLMIFLPSGATASFPDEATVERHYRSKHAFYRLAKWVGTDKAFFPTCSAASGRMPSPALRLRPTLASKQWHRQWGDSSAIEHLHDCRSRAGGAVAARLVPLVLIIEG